MHLTNINGIWYMVKCDLNDFDGRMKPHGDVPFNVLTPTRMFSCSQVDPTIARI